MTTKAQLIDHLAATGLVDQDVARVLIDLTSQFYTTALQGSGEATIPGIGKLKLGTRSQRMGRNPKTGESLQIPAKKVVKLSASKGLKQAIE